MGATILRYAFVFLMTFHPFMVCASEEVKGRVWIKKDGESFVEFPEQEADQTVYPFPKNWEQSKKNGAIVGVVFSGGGTRSATLTLGQLRALNELEWVDDIHYISAVSGGSWAAVPFTYFQGENLKDLLGPYIAPNKLSDDHLKKKANGSLGKAITKSGVIRDVLSAWFGGKGDESYAHVLGEVFLKPFGLAENRFFTSYSTENSAGDVLKEILQENPHLKKTDFYSIKRKTPFLLVGGTLQKTHHGFTSVESKPEDIFPLEITPLYVGISSEPAALGGDRKKIGGGYVEPLMYDSRPPKKAISVNDFQEEASSNDGMNPKTLTVTKSRYPVTLESSRNRFTLADVIAVSGAAPQAFFTGSLRYLLIPSNFGFPELMHWPITTNQDEYKPKTSEDFVHGDGGNIDNIGLLPLLSRQVDRVIVFVNTYKKFILKTEGLGSIIEESMYSDVVDYFLYNPKRPKNVVFWDYEKFFQLYEGLKKKKGEGEPLIYCDDYDVKRNTHHNIFPYKAHICWVYNDKPERWVQLIMRNEKLIEEGPMIVNEENPYKTIPHTRTFFQQWHDMQVLDRKIQHVNAESNISAWVVCESAGTLAEEIFNHISTQLNQTDCAKQRSITTEVLKSEKVVHPKIDSTLGGVIEPD